MKIIIPKLKNFNKIINLKNYQIQILIYKKISLIKKINKIKWKFNLDQLNINYSYHKIHHLNKSNKIGMFRLKKIKNLKKIEKNVKEKKPTQIRFKIKKKRIHKKFKIFKFQNQ